MTMDAIQTLITSVGFPISCVIALGWFIYKAYNKLMERSEEREERLYSIILTNQEEMKKITDINREFAEVLYDYKDELGIIRRDVTEIKEYFKGKEQVN